MSCSSEQLFFSSYYGRLSKIDDIDEAAFIIVAPIMFMVQQCDLDEDLKKNISYHVERHIRALWKLLS